MRHNVGGRRSQRAEIENSAAALHAAQMPESLINIYWITFCIYWGFSGFKAKRVIERQKFAHSLPYKILTIIGFLLVVWRKAPGVPPILFTTPGPVVDYVSVGLCLLGLAETIWARRTLAGNWSADVTFKEEHKFVDRGPYRVVRHPIYSGVLLMALGTALSSGRFVAVLGLILLFAGCWMKSRQEELLLMKYFPEEYAGYKRRVKAFVPLLL
jgi:protein-S-isoprenylcysteine O-methyltransferase Ste14